MTEHNGEARPLIDDDGVEISYRSWLPDSPPKAIVLILHGASEHGGRYARFGEHLAAAGYAAYADDHRGFGLTAPSTGAGIAGPRGFDGVLDSIHAVQRRALGDVGRVPVIVFGHSMGSVFTQVYAQRHGAELAGVALCGSFGPSPDIEAMVAGLQAAVDSGMVDQPVDMLAAFNAAFEPARTAFDWLSRDEAEVDAYLADPMAGTDAPMSFGYILGVLKLLGEGTDPERIALIPKELPILLITGAADPVSNGGETVRDLEERYRDAGLHVTAQYYADARHELLNEINRDEVEADVMAWLETCIPR